MRPLIFLASSIAIKPTIILKRFYECIDRDASQDYLLTDGQEGKTVDLARQIHLSIIQTSDYLFTNQNSIDQIINVVPNNGILISCGWPYKIPPTFFPKFFVALNCHGSYLPDYRGSRAYMHYWANCSDFFGATIHYINENFDDGNILIRGKGKILPNESQDVVFERTAELCGHLLPTAICLAEAGNPGFKGVGQRRYFFKRTPEEFEQHRLENEHRIAEGKDVILTPHKVIMETEE